MFTRLAENAVNAYILFGTLAVVAILAFLITRRVVYLGAVVGLAALAGGVGLVDHLVVTDREQVEINTREMLLAADRKDVEGFGQHISAQFHSEGIDRKALLDRARDVLPNIKQIAMRNLEVIPSKDGKTITSTCTLDVKGTVEGYALDGYPYHLKLIFVLDDDKKWRVREFEVWDATANRRYYPPSR